MKRLIFALTLLVLMGLNVHTIAAQDASPAAAASPDVPATPLLDALGYPTLPITYDGSNVTMPATLTAGRYLVDATNTSGSTPQVALFLGATADHSIDEIMTALQSADSSQGPPPIYFEAKVVDLAELMNREVITLTSGDWVFAVIGDQGPAVSMLSVTGDLPTYDAIPDTIDVGMHEMAFDMPDSIPAGDHIWQIENTGSFPHMMVVVKTDGPVTDEQVMNALALEMGAPDATPVEAGSAGDLQSSTSIFDSAVISNGHTQLIEIDLEPGNYLALCFVDGPGDVGLHAMQGMYKIFTVE